jgi:hypothetical protein
MIEPQHSIQDSIPYDLLAKLRKRLDYKWPEIIQESAIDPAVALERGYYIDKTEHTLFGFAVFADRHGLTRLLGSFRRRSCAWRRSEYQPRRPSSPADRSP